MEKEVMENNSRTEYAMKIHKVVKVVSCLNTFLTYLSIDTMVAFSSYQSLGRFSIFRGIQNFKIGLIFLPVLVLLILNTSSSSPAPLPL